MKYVKMTFKYFTIKKFLKLFLIALIPALAITSISSISSLSDFLVNYAGIDLSSFASIYNSVSDFKFSRFPLYILVVAVFIMGIAEIYGAVERDMRVGDFTLRGFFRRVNNNGVVLGMTIIFLILSVLLMGVASSALFFLWAVIVPGFVAHMLSILVTIVFFSLLLVLWANFFLMAPTMLITGQSVFDSVRSSIKFTQIIFFKLIFAFLVPILPAFVLIYLERGLGLNIAFILDILIKAFFIVYYVVLMLVIHYDLTGLAREDLNPSKRYFS